MKINKLAFPYILIVTFLVLFFLGFILGFTPAH